jgi:hypothetical protein
LGLLAELRRLMSGQLNLQRSTCMNKRGGGLLVADVAPALAKGTAGVKLAGRTKRVTAAKPEALEPKE